MTQLSQMIDALYQAIEAIEDFPARLERSPIRAITRNEYPAVVIHRGAETVSDDSPWPLVTRIRQIYVTVHCAGDGAEDEADEIFLILQPVFANFTYEDLVITKELSTDEPRYAQGDLTRVAITRRWALTYQTKEDAL